MSGLMVRCLRGSWSATEFLASLVLHVIAFVPFRSTAHKPSQHIMLRSACFVLVLAPGTKPRANVPKMVSSSSKATREASATCTPHNAQINECIVHCMHLGEQGVV